MTLIPLRHLIWLVPWLLAAHAAAAPRVGVEIGWEGQYSMASWAPVYVTVQDTVARAAVLDISGFVDPQQEMRVRQSVSLSPTPATYVVYTRLTNLMQTTLELREPGGRLLFDATLDQMVSNAATYPYYYGSQQQRLLAGVSGRDSTMRRVGRQLRDIGWQAGHQTPNRVPDTAVGFDALDVLILDCPDWSELGPSQQQAIADWVRGGGTLVIWPGPGAWPGAGPLVSSGWSGASHVHSSRPAARSMMVRNAIAHESSTCPLKDPT